MSTTLLDGPSTHPETPMLTPSEAADRLRGDMAAVRLGFTWLGVRKSLTAEQRELAADSFGAEGRFLSAGKKLLDTAHPAFRAVTAVRGRCHAHWKGASLPYPEPGIRLLPRGEVAGFDRRIAQFREELGEAVAGLDRHYGELRAAARRRLGELFDPADYPGSLAGLFAIEHDFPSVEPPDYLRRLAPSLYEEECRRVRARFDEAVRLAEEAFAGELADLVSRLGERLSGEADGKPKVFRDSAVTNLAEFFARFRSLSVRSSGELDELVGQAEAALAGVGPDRLRESRPLRERLAAELGTVRSSLEGLLVDRPRRNILRRPR